MASSRRRSGIDWVVRRVAADPEFLASALNEYRVAHDLTDAQLADFLGCKGGAVTRLALCRVPRSTHALFRPDVEQIALYVHCMPERLAQLVREVIAARALRAPSAAETRLLAARDRRNRLREGWKRAGPGKGQDGDEGSSS
jgi:hypothetical protein